MSVTVTVNVSKDHPSKVWAQRERWTPKSDDGSTFTPGQWQPEGEKELLKAGVDHPFEYSDDHSVKVWSSSEPAEAPLDHGKV